MFLKLKLSYDFMKLHKSLMGHFYDAFMMFFIDLNFTAHFNWAYVETSGQDVHIKILIYDICLALRFKMHSYLWVGLKDQWIIWTEFVNHLIRKILFK